MRALAGVVALGMISAGQALAQGASDAASVCAASERHYAAIRAGNLDAVLQQHLPDVTLFGGEGGLLWALQSPEQLRAEVQEMTSQGTTAKVYLRHCSAQVYGNTGIATFYLVGAVTTGGNTTSGTWRVTEVWVRQGNEWKEAHHHESPLLGSVRP